MAYLLALLSLPLLAMVFLIRAVWHRKQAGYRGVWVWAVVIVLLLLSNPMSQYFLLEGIDGVRGSAMAREAYSAGIVGMDGKQVRMLLGEPTRIRKYGDVTTWEYKQVPGYWLSSYFQVFFRDGRVYGIEPNDD